MTCSHCQEPEVGEEVIATNIMGNWTPEKQSLSIQCASFASCSSLSCIICFGLVLVSSAVWFRFSDNDLYLLFESQYALSVRFHPLFSSSKS